MVAVAEVRSEQIHSALSLQEISKLYHVKGRPKQILKNISLDIGQGEFVCVVGASGCGKSTLLNIVAGLDRADHGEIFEKDKPITGPSRDRLMMFQDPALFPWLNVLDNVLFPLKLIPELDKKKRLEIALRHLRMVGLARFKRYFVHELSGGMKSRVALARALAPNPQILLMDEPFAALDAMTREQLYVDLQRIWTEEKKTVLLVTHNIREAVCLGDRVVLMAGSPGEIKHEFMIDLPRPRDINSIALANYSAAITAALKGIPAVYEGI